MNGWVASILVWEVCFDWIYRTFVPIVCILHQLYDFISFNFHLFIVHNSSDFFVFSFRFVVAVFEACHPPHDCLQSIICPTMCIVRTLYAGRSSHCCHHFWMADEEWPMQILHRIKKTNSHKCDRRHSSCAFGIVCLRFPIRWQDGFIPDSRGFHSFFSHFFAHFRNKEKL